MICILNRRQDSLNITFTFTEKQKFIWLSLLQMFALFWWSRTKLAKSPKVCLYFSSVLSRSRVRLFATPWTAARQASPSISNFWSLLKLMSTESVMPSNHLILLSSPSPPDFSLSQHQDLFQWVSSSHQVARVLELQLQYQSFQWIFKTDL